MTHPLRAVLRPAAACLLAVALVAVSTPAAAQRCGPPEGAADDGVAAALARLVAALNAKDLAAAMALMASDVVLSHAERADAPRSVVEAGFRARWKGEARLQVEAALEDLCETEHLAVLRITWTARFTTPSGEAVTTRERDVETWTRQDGAWKLTRGLGVPLSPP